MVITSYTRTYVFHHHPVDISPLPVLPRLNKTIETLRARPVHQSRQRGTLESDPPSTFSRDHLSVNTQGKLKVYDKILRYTYYWATDNWVDSRLLEKLRVHARNEGKVVHKMPPL
ncbi:hypothetical protein BYT27DRAFT_7284485 [Phlegmacium glaucopus]|nr:hypothetical protein BYT27DRAFT_7284485 [Phlegmacium glaucopus]